MKKINIALVGYGVIGSGVLELLKQNHKIFSDKTGIDFEIKYIVDKDPSKLKGLKGIETTDNYKKAILDKEVSLIIELTGAIDFSYKLFEEASNEGKHFITANKALLSKKLLDMFAIARKNKTYIGFEASVAGGIPIIKTIRNYLIGNKILDIEGIINGTTNYILTKMTDENLEFNTALKKAQELGFAEADPTMDISGGDAASKLAILASISFNQNIQYDDVIKEGIDKIDLMDIQYAKELGYQIKLIGIARIVDGEGVEAHVHPTLVGNKNPLSSVKNEFNAILINADFLGLNMYYGKGAGSRPTATAVLSDIVEIGLKTAQGKEYNPQSFELSSKKQIRPLSSVVSKYYLRIMTEDKPGILAKIGTVLGDNGISLASVIQKDTEKDFAQVVFTTYKATETQFAASIETIKKFPFVKKTVYYRISD